VGDASQGTARDPFLPLILAEQWGVVPPHHNYLLDQAGYEPGDAWSGEFAGEIGEIRDASAGLARESEAPPFVSVDSPTTRDIDDAFFAERLPDGGCLVRLALADPASAWRFDAPLDRAVMRRASSVYLPEGTSHMMPEAFAADVFSLVEKKPRPALVMEWDIDAAGAARRFGMRSGWVTGAANRTYADVEAELAGPAPGPGVEAGLALAEVLRARRVDAGAAIIERVEPDIVLSGPADEPLVDLVPSGQYPRAQLLVSELMILANSSAAGYAAAAGIPHYISPHDAVLPRELAGIWPPPEDINQVVKHLPPTAWRPGPAPRGHRGEGLCHRHLAASPLCVIWSIWPRCAIFSRPADPNGTGPNWSTVCPRSTPAPKPPGRIQRFRPRYWNYCISNKTAAPGPGPASWSNPRSVRHPGPARRPDLRPGEPGATRGEDPPGTALHPAAGQGGPADQRTTGLEATETDGE
jgi:exoribonuclease-2